MIKHTQQHEIKTTERASRGKSENSFNDIFFGLHVLPCDSASAMLLQL